MEAYNKIMQIIWLILGFGIIILVTVMGLLQGFDRWAGYYWLAGIVLVFYFIRRFMLKRMEKHQEFLMKKEEEMKQQKAPKE